ncbi:MAG TPA: two-component regulator propeller domain-containing protein, partial [Chitinophagaceae bacterium]|nr:two-component regulator propeller domain-containing protein [Chitinophagaceae bacterium]
MKITRLLLWILIATGVQHPSSGQAPSFNFHHLSTDAGLSNGTIRGVAKDKYGYIWIGTLNGLNRYNGYDVKVFRHNRLDTFSLPENAIGGLLCDHNGDLWVSTRKGICAYNYSTARFTLLPGSGQARVLKMQQAANDTLYVATSKGLALFSTNRPVFTYVADHCSGISKALLSRWVGDVCPGPHGTFYLATDTGLVVYDPAARQAKRVVIKPLGNRGIGKLGIDKNENVWMSYGDGNDSLLCVDKDFSVFHVYGQYFVSPNNLKDNTISAIFVDNKNRVWVSAVR